MTESYGPGEKAHHDTKAYAQALKRGIQRVESDAVSKFLKRNASHPYRAAEIAAHFRITASSATRLLKKAARKHPGVVIQVPGGEWVWQLDVVTKQEDPTPTNNKTSSDAPTQLTQDLRDAGPIAEPAAVRHEPREEAPLPLSIPPGGQGQTSGAAEAVYRLLREHPDQAWSALKVAKTLGMTERTTSAALSYLSRKHRFSKNATPTGIVRVLRGLYRYQPVHGFEHYGHVEVGPAPSPSPAEESNNTVPTAPLAAPAQTPSLEAGFKSGTYLEIRQRDADGRYQAVTDDGQTVLLKVWRRVVVEEEL